MMMYLHDSFISRKHSKVIDILIGGKDIGIIVNLNHQQKEQCASKMNCPSFPQSDRDTYYQQYCLTYKYLYENLG